MAGGMESLPLRRGRAGASTYLYLYQLSYGTMLSYRYPRGGVRQDCV